MWDEFLAQLGFPNLKYEDLTPEEKMTFETKIQLMQKSELTIPKVREFLGYVREGIDHELIKCDPKKDEYKMSRLLARLENIMLYQAFLTTPEKAKQELQTMLKNIKK